MCIYICCRWNSTIKRKLVNGEMLLPPALQADLEAAKASGHLAGVCVCVSVFG
jgi:hypothetical protein